MPRAARIKEATAIYHVMSRSITEFDLFPDDSDKEVFLDILQKYKEKCNCKIYAYCLMGNHYHLIVDTCGFDISRFMKSVNQSYVKFINRKYGRRGHLLTERFNSKIIDSDSYMLTASAYIHNNPKDLSGFEGREHEYRYSSMGFYSGRQKDRRNLVDTNYILGCISKANKARACKAYTEMVVERRDAGINQKLDKYLEEFWNEQYEYRSYREVLFRDRKPEEVISKIASWFKIEDVGGIVHRWKRSTLNFRRVAAYALTVFCGLGSREACRYMHNVTASGLAELSRKGFEILNKSIDLKECLLKA